MRTKLPLTIEQDVIKAVKAYAPKKAEAYRSLWRTILKLWQLKTSSLKHYLHGLKDSGGYRTSQRL